MSLISYVRFLFERARFPAREDFLSEGYGIEARYRRCRKFWSKHLELSKAFQRRALDDSDKRLAILGVGRLLDVEYPAQSIERIELFDADPGCRRAWETLAKRLRGKVEVGQHFSDLTGCIDVWSARLAALQRPLERSELKRLLISLASEQLEAFPLPKVDVVVSLNLISQIPIYWRERILAAAPHLAEDREIEQALDSSLAQLQRHHLRTLEKSGAKKIVVIGDEEFLYYKKDLSPWQTERALFFSESIALKGYDLTAEESWLWHIAPQGIEFPDYGAIHRVVARTFTLKTARK